MAESKLKLTTQGRLENKSFYNNVLEYYHIDLLSHKSALTTKYAETTTVNT